MRRGSVLLEVLVAVAILVGAGSAILAASDRGERLLRTSRDHAQAADLARSVLSSIEAGLVTPQSAPGAVRSGAAGAAWMSLDPDGVLPEAAAGEGRWRVEVESEPTTWNGLARVTVQVFDHRGGDGAPAVYSLVQLVRLSPVGSDSAGEQSVKGPQSKPKAPAPRGKGGKP